MHNSRIWDEYEKIAAEKGLVKTAADKKNPEYDVIPPAAGPDTKVDHDGWELVEIAHPEQVQVARSQLEDGVVENGVERQKIMIDVALRNPRGVLAELMEVLVKVANELDEKTDDQSIKLASEVDTLLEKMAQARYDQAKQLWLAGSETLDALRAMQFPFWNSKLKDMVEQAVANLERIELDAKADGLSPKILVTLAYWAVSNYKSLRAELEHYIRSGASGTDRAALALGELYRDASKYIAMLHPATDSTAVPHAPDGYGVLKPETHEAPHGIASPEEGAHSMRHNWNTALDAEKVKELQTELGFFGRDVDGKFGQHTFSAVMNEANQNRNIQMALKNFPHYAQSFMNWDNNAVDTMTRYIKQQKEEFGKRPKFQPSTGLMETYTTQEKPVPAQEWTKNIEGPSKLTD